MAGPILLAEDDEARANRLRVALQARGFGVIMAADGAQALELAGSVRPVAVVSDVLMPNMDGFELCWEIRRAGPLLATPVILTTTGWEDDDSGQFARDVGATALVDTRTVADVLDSVLAVGMDPAVADQAAPAARLTEDEFRLRHGERLLHLSLREAEILKQERDALAEIYRGTLGSLAAVLDLHDAAGAHARRVTGYVITLAEALGLGPGDPAVGHLVRSALLCDIGNMGIPQRIVNKPGILSHAEWQLMKTHPVLSATAVEEVAPVRSVGETVRAHHERWDGQGYPARLAGEVIPWAARVIAVADTVDALTSPRPYRESVPFEAAATEIDRCRETQFDPEISDAASSVDPAEWGMVKEQAESLDPKFDALVAGYL
jgi:putative two-component system response regulator